MRNDKGIYTSRYFRQGNSFAVVIPPDLRDRMELKLGDVLVMNYSHGVLWAKKLTPGMLVSRETISKIFDELFPGGKLQDENT